MNKQLTTVEEVKQAVAQAFGSDWMFTVIKTGGWQAKYRQHERSREDFTLLPAKPTGDFDLVFKNGSYILLRARPGGVRMYVHASWMAGWAVSGQMRFNPRFSTVKYAVDAIRQQEVIEDFDLLKV